MHKLEFVLANETHGIIKDFEIQTDHLIPARRPDLELNNKQRRTCHFVDFVVPTDHQVKIEESEKRQILEPCQAQSTSAVQYVDCISAEG